jgi:hypothetical protein
MPASGRNPFMPASHTIPTTAPPSSPAQIFVSSFLQCCEQQALSGITEQYTDKALRRIQKEPGLSLFALFARALAFQTKEVQHCPL